MITIVLRTVIVYLLIILAVRLMGKRQLGELQPSELVTTILISNLASLPIEETDLPLVGSLAPIFMIVAMEIFLSVIEIKNARFARFISGNSKVIIKDGVIDQSVMRTLRYSVQDLLESLRNKDIFDIREVDFGIIETNGTLNVYKKQPFQNPVNRDLNIEPTGAPRPPVAIVVDGKIQHDALAFCMKDEIWLNAKLRELNVALSDLLLLQCDPSGDCFVVRRTGK